MSEHQKQVQEPSEARAPAPKLETPEVGWISTADSPTSPASGVAPWRAAEVSNDRRARVRSAAQSIQGASLQLKSEGGARSVADPHDIARAGVQGSGSSLPHLDRIQQSFGEHDVSSVKAHTGVEAQAASASLGARGFTLGQDVALKGGDLHTAAHEATHAVQQRMGHGPTGGMGAAGDALEVHADAVADKVVRGESAAELLSAPPAGGGSGGLQLAGEGDKQEGGEAPSKDTSGEKGASTGKGEESGPVLDPKVADQAAMFRRLGLENPLVQDKGTTACWFLSVLFGLHQAGWVRSLFAQGIFQVRPGKEEGTFEWISEGQTGTVAYLGKGKPLWQRILENKIDVILQADTQARTWVESMEPQGFQKKVKALGTTGGLDRMQLKTYVSDVLGMVYSGWAVEEQDSSTPDRATRTDGPLAAFKDGAYPSRGSDGTSVDVLTVEKSGHAMGVSGLEVRGGKRTEAQPTGRGKATKDVKVDALAAKIRVHNQSFGKEANYPLTPEHRKGTLDPTAASAKAQSWAKPIDTLNHYGISSQTPMTGPVESVTFKPSSREPAGSVSGIDQVGALQDVSGDGMNCLIRALMVAAGRTPDETVVQDMRAHLVATTGIAADAMIDLMEAEGAILLSALTGLGVLPASRGLRVYYRNGPGLSFHKVLDGENPLKLYLDGGHFQAIC